MSDAPIPARVITVSDRCSAGTAEDRSGPLAEHLLAEHRVLVDRVDIVPDGVASVSGAIAAAISDGVRVVFTTGGTGVSPRDLTPEATEPLLAVRLDGIAHAMRQAGRASTVRALISRGLVGLTGRGPDAVLVINAPGSTGGVRDAVSVVGPLIAHLLDQAAGADH